MSCAFLHVDGDTRMVNTVETCEFSHDKEHCINHVVHMNVIGLTGIVLDSAKTKETVSKDKNMLIPPRQMKASLVVIRDNKLLGMSSMSKGLMRSIAAPSSVVSNGKSAQTQRRYLTLWNNKISSENSSILFEAELSERSSCTPCKNFEVFIGLTAYVDSITTTIPIGVASLPLVEAAALQGPSGKVVLDLPVYSISPLQAESTNVFKKSSVENEISHETERKSKRGLFSSFRKRQMTREKTVRETVTPSVPANSKRPCVYTMDTSSDEPSILRVELELQRKEVNVEIGISSLSSFDPMLMAEKKHDCLPLFFSNVSDTIKLDAIQNFEKNMDRTTSMDQFMEDQSFERVLSIRSERTLPVKPRFHLNPTRRFRVRCIDRTSSKFELTPVRNDYDEAQIQSSISSLKALKDLSSPDKEFDGNDDLVDVPIERVLSGSAVFDDDALMVALAQLTEEDSYVQGNEIPFDEQSFLSRDTTAFKSEKKVMSTKIIELDLNSEEPATTLKIPFLWRRGKKVKTSETKNLPSVAGTESSNHSSSNSVSTSESHGRNFEYAPVDRSGDQLISVSSNSELICETPTKPSPSKFPVSILRTPATLKHKVKESMGRLLIDGTSTEHFPDEDINNTSTVHSDGVSVVSCSADTALLRKGETFSWHPGEINDKEIYSNVEREAELLLGTNATPHASTYSNPLPHFVEETTKPIILREMYEFDDDNGFLKQKISQSKTLNFHGAACSLEGAFARHEKPTTPLSHNFYRFIDLQPCSGKIEPLLAVDDEDFTIAESWTHNDNSTLGTFEPPKETMHDDIADLGLLFDDMCRQSGFRTIQDDFSIMDDGHGAARETITTSLLDKNGGRQRWIAALGSSTRMPFVDSTRKFKRKAAVHSPLINADDDSDLDEQSFSVPSSGQSSETSVEQTLRSSAEESASLLSEVGTEVNFDDVGLMQEFKSENESGNLEVENRAIEDIRKENAPAKITAVIPNTFSHLPPKNPGRKKTSTQHPSSVNMKTKLHVDVFGVESNGSRKDSSSHSRKSFAQSFVEFVEYVITPSPYITEKDGVPTHLDGDETSSVGELTATTYERQIDIDIMRRQCAKQDSHLVNDTATAINDAYFKEYDDSLSPEVTAAMEAAAVKKLAEGLVGFP